MKKLTSEQRFELAEWKFEESKRYGKIYFIQGELTKLIKIGFTSDLKKRLESFEYCSPDKLILLGFMPGDEKMEAKLHNTFKRYHHHGEWFRPNKKLFEFIKIIKDENVDAGD